MRMQILENHVTRPFTNEAINNKFVNQSYWIIRQYQDKCLILVEMKAIKNEQSY